MPQKVFSVFFVPLLLAATLICGGCATYIYQGRIEAKDSGGKERQFVVFWNETSRMLWFDSTAGSITLLTECSANAVKFDEQPNGIFFRKRPSDMFVIPTALSKDVCGEVLNVKRIRDLEGGDLSLRVSCKPITEDEFAIRSALNYLEAKENPYVFPVTRSVTKDLANDTPKRPICRE